MIEDSSGSRGAQFEPPLLGLVQDVGAAGLIGDENAADIADLVRFDVFVGQRVALDGADVDAALVGKGRFADIGLVAVVRQVGQFVDQTGGAVEAVDVFAHLAGQAHLEDQGRDDRGQVGIAAAFAEAVDRALDLIDAAGDRQQGVGDGGFRVVVGVDAELDLCSVAVEILFDPFDDRRQFMGQGAAVGVAEDDGLRSAVDGPGQGRQGIVRIVLEAVEKMLGIVDADVRPSAAGRPASPR